MNKSKTIFIVIISILLLPLLISVFWVFRAGVFPVTWTPLMSLRANEVKSKVITKPVVWRPLNEMSPWLVKAVLMSEDQKFYMHSGFDFEAIARAMDHNRKNPTKVKGASTISQQTAKNVFLWPGRSWIRKGLEAYFTVLIETFWSKDRILEVYLNVIEFGSGIYGAQAASKEFFKKDVKDLSLAEAALLASCLPNPRKWKVSSPGPFQRDRQEQIIQLVEGRRKIIDDLPESVIESDDPEIPKQPFQANTQMPSAGVHSPPKANPPSTNQTSETDFSDSGRGAGPSETPPESMEE